MPISYDVEKDGLYLRGVEKGIQKGIKKGIEKGIAQSVWNFYNGGFSIQVIAKNLNLTTQQVEQYIQDWEAKS